MQTLAMGKLFALIAAVSLLASGLSSPAAAQSRSDQATARERVEAGRMLSIREIEKRIIPQVKGTYLGPEYDDTASAYRLKFINGSQVIWVDVDARTARIMHISK